MQQVQDKFVTLQIINVPIHEMIVSVQTGRVAVEILIENVSDQKQAKKIQETPVAAMMNASPRFIVIQVKKYVCLILVKIRIVLLA